MNQSTPRAIQHLFQVSSLESVSREQLETFVEEYPCFGFGHFLLSRKLQAENSEQFPAATQKTSLYFPNPFWLQWMLENAVDPSAKDNPPHTLQEGHHAHITRAIHEDSVHVEEPPAEVPDVHAEPPIPDDHIAHFEQPIPDDHITDIEQRIQDDQVDHAYQPTPEVPTIQHEEPIRDEEPAFVVEETSHWPEMESPDVPSATSGLPVDFDSRPIVDEEPPFVLDETDRSPEPAPPVSDAPAPLIPEAPQPAATVVATPLNESSPLFEPLHTIDYFASQGIRLTLDENPTDALGRQLKSFTEWLRTMRRLPQKDREIIPDRVAEQTVQNFAAHSIEGKEPITETMAEVLAKQGMPERARIVYEKLSLLDPDKRAYFAAKIEQLNIP